MKALDISKMEENDVIDLVTSLAPGESVIYFTGLLRRFGSMFHPATKMMLKCGTDKHTPVFHAKDNVNPKKDEMGLGLVILTQQVIQHGTRASVGVYQYSCTRRAA